MQQILRGDILQEAVTCLKHSGIVAIPTETYYGLAVDPFNETALRALFHLKKRELHKPILVLLHDIRHLDALVASIPDQFFPLMEKFWPGPLTLIFPGRPGLSPLLTGGTGTVGVRISSNPIAAQFCRLWGGPITATSANISGTAPAESADDVSRIFGTHIDCILNGGVCPGGACSTIVGLHDNKPVLIREGKIDFSKILQVEKEFYKG